MFRGRSGLGYIPCFPFFITGLWLWGLLELVVGISWGGWGIRSYLWYVSYRE